MNENYAHIVKDMSLKIEISADEAAAVLAAYDDGIECLSVEEQHLLDVVISKMKDQIFR